MVSKGFTHWCRAMDEVRSEEQDPSWRFSSLWSFVEQIWDRLNLIKSEKLLQKSFESGLHRDALDKWLGAHADIRKTVSQLNKEINELLPLDMVTPLLLYTHH